MSIITQFYNVTNDDSGSINEHWMSGESVDKDNDDGDGTTCNRGNNLGIIENDGQLDREPKILK